MTKLTPARKQYLDIKKQFPDCILFFRMGDFYETFDEDAILTARELEITLTQRTEGQPMAGVPYHALDQYVARLIDKGYHVAVCDQVSEPTGRGIVEREVTRVLTPGTLTEPSLLSEGKPNYLMAIYPMGDARTGRWTHAGIAYVDISTGEFATTQLEGENAGVQVLEELARLAPREVLMPQVWVDHGATLPEGIHMTPAADWMFDAKTARQNLLDHFKVGTLDGFGLADLPAAVCASGAVVQYLRTTQKNALSQLTQLRPYSTQSFMLLDQFTRRNLELTQTIRTGQTQGSVLGILDHTCTAMGSRLLRTWLNQPLLDIQRLNARLDAVEALVKDEIMRLEVREALRDVSDLERLVNRIIIHKASPRDLLGLVKGLGAIPRILEHIQASPALTGITERLDPHQDVCELIQRAIAPNAPSNAAAIGVINPGFSEELDHILESSRHAREWIAELEPKERRRTGIASLKVGFNKVFGYYIEVTTANADRVPGDYIRKQTMVNAERYITPELKEYETIVLNAEEEILAAEKRIFEELCTTIAQQASQLLRTARTLAHLDVFVSLATVAANEGYVRPRLSDGDVLRIRSGRHPVVEKLLSAESRYTPNDTLFNTQSRIHIITGPNMAGKSTYIRQVAIITLLAQIGSFVPADEAEIGVVDRIFARIGAQDEIHAGQSTFMVEMVETARLLSGSTQRSLVILDEIGRGTSTYDGLAIARAVIEYLHNNPRLNCRTLFATHYHELTELPNILPRATNYSIAVTERDESIVFLHKVIPGGADRSYGVHVAQLAGLPKPVIERARELLQLFENSAPQRSRTVAGRISHEPAAQPAPQPDPGMASVASALKQMDVNHLSPIEALTKLYELKQMLSS
jgi:DNA mismatch repair protein MutS